MPWSGRQQVDAISVKPVGRRSMREGGGMKQQWYFSGVLVFFSCFALLVPMVTDAMPVTPGTLPGKVVTALVPEGWKIISQAGGDLNGDNCVDQVLILESTSPVEMKRDNQPAVKAFPRSVLVAFGAADGRFVTMLQNDHFIPAGFENDSMGSDFTWEELAVSPKGVITLGFQVEFPAGRASLKYLFRYQKTVFALIGAESENLQRGPGEFFAASYNFLTHKVKYEKGGIFDEPQVKTSIRWGRAALKAPVSLATIKNPNVEDLHLLVVESGLKKPQ